MYKYKITNYGNTRTIYVKGQSWELSKNQSITIDRSEVENAQEVAKAFEKLEFIDVEKTRIKQSPPDKKKVVKKTKKVAKKAAKTKKKKV